MPADFRTTLRPPSHPTTYRAPMNSSPASVDGDPGGFLVDADHLASTVDRHPQLVDPVGEDALDVVLPQRQPVRVPGGKVTDVQADLAESGNLGGVALGQEAIRDTPLVEHFDGAGVQAPRTRTDEAPVAPAFDDRDVHPRQRQLAGQRHTGRTPTDDHHVMVGKLTHPHPPIAEKLVRPAILRQPGGLAASPPVRYMLKVAESLVPPLSPSADQGAQ